MTTVRKAIQALETIGDEVNLSIIHFLKSHSEVSFSNLGIATGLPSIQLEKHLKFLLKNDIVVVNDFPSKRSYTLNQYKVLKIKLLTKALMHQPIEV